jgi:DNA-binding SARP family transcriptional activator
MAVMGGDRADVGLAVGLLGPVEIGPAGGVMTSVAQPRLRVLLGLLGVSGGRMVTAEALVDGVWGEEWSPGREKNLHALAYQLRRRLAALEPGRSGTRLARAGAGYRLALEAGELDVAVFRDLAGRGREAARAGDAAAARELFAQALGLWRGAALADAAPLCRRLAGEAARLEELRLAVTEERVGCDLALGRHGEMAGELAGLVAEFPLRERLAALLMTALYRCGRRGEALAVYEATRRVLAGELGLDPGPELASLAAEHRPGRYVLHDLVRSYAARLARPALGEAGIRAALERSLDHYLHTVIVLYVFGVIRVITVAPPVPGVLPEQLAGEAETQEWLQAEHQVLLQATVQAAAAGLVTRAWQLFASQAYILSGRGYWADIRDVGQAVLAAAEAAGDQVGLGWTHETIGRSGMFIGAGHEDLVRALEHFRRAGDLSGQATTHLVASMACAVRGDWAEGVTQAGRALALFQQTGDQTGQGWARAALAEHHARLGNDELARGYARQALELGPAASNFTFLAIAWDALGIAHARLGESRQAIGCYRRGLALVRELKTPEARAMQATMLAGSGDACRAAGHLPAAVEAWQQALQVLRDLGWPDFPGVGARLRKAGSPGPPG